MIKEEIKEALRTETADVDTLVAIGLKDQTKHTVFTYSSWKNVCNLNKWLL